MQSVQEEITTGVQKNGSKSVVAILSRDDNGTVGLTINTSMEGSNKQQYRSVRVTSDDRIYVNNETNIVHTKKGQSCETVGSSGTNVDPVLAQEIRDAYERFKTRGLKASDDITNVSHFIDLELQKVPQQEIDRSKQTLFISRASC